MDILFLCLVVFLFLLAIFDLSVGVSNDAVNFLNSALGSKAAPFKRVLIVASIGVFIGAAMSNGMMDIARHGIFRPEHFSFYDLICIFMAVTEAFASENVKVLGKAASSLLRQKKLAEKHPPQRNPWPPQNPARDRNRDERLQFFGRRKQIRGIYLHIVV